MRASKWKVGRGGANSLLLFLAVFCMFLGVLLTVSTQVSSRTQGNDGCAVVICHCPPMDGLSGNQENIPESPSKVHSVLQIEKASVHQSLSFPRGKMQEQYVLLLC